MTTPDSSPRSGTVDTHPVRWSFDRLRIDHTHTRYHHRIARGLADHLPKVLEADEKVLGFTEAIEESDFITRAAMGFGWPLWRRVALLFTDRRLLEIGLACCGRRASGRVRSFPWDMIPGLNTKEFQFEVATWREASHSWRLRERLDTGLERAIRRQCDLAVSTYQPSQGLSVPIRQCDHCGAAMPAQRGTCRRCRRRVRSSRLAGLLALAFPGAGHGYSGRWGAATLRLVLECAVFGWLASRILASSTLPEAVMSMAAGAVAIGIVKLQGSTVARLLAARAELVSPTAERRWRWFAVSAAVLSVIALLVPLSLVGETDGDVSWDLSFVVTDGEWTGQQAWHPADNRPPDDVLRSQWLHRTGLRAEVRAWPMQPFESPGAAVDRVADQALGETRLLVLGPHRVVASRVDGDHHTTMRYALVDEVGRDLHVVSADIPHERAEEAAHELERLISRGIWVLPAPSRAGHL
jgi:hypothetical protein